MSERSRRERAGVGDVIDVVKEYARQETLGPLKGAGRWLALGSIDNSLRFQNNPALLAEAVPEICALDDVLARVVFGVSDALICQYRGEESLRLYDTLVLNELRFSRDPLALDALAVDDIIRAHKASPYAVGKIYETDLYVNAELLELGVSDLKRIDVRKGK